MDQQRSYVWNAEPATLTTVELTMVAKSMILARRALHQHLPSDFIHDAPLDLLLCLFVAHSEHRAVTSDALIKTTTVVDNVARRWMSALVDVGLLIQRNDRVELTEKGRRSMIDTLRAVADSQSALHEVI